MTRRPPLLALAPILAALACLAALLPSVASAARPARAQRSMVFEVCGHGCRYQTIQQAVEAAGSYAFHNKAAKVIVTIRPGRYVEGIVVDGIERRHRYDGMTIEGTKD